MFLYKFSPSHSFSKQVVQSSILTYLCTLEKSYVIRLNPSTTGASISKLSFVKRDCCLESWSKKEKIMKKDNDKEVERKSGGGGWRSIESQIDKKKKRKVVFFYIFYFPIIQKEQYSQGSLLHLLFVTFFSCINIVLGLLPKLKINEWIMVEIPWNDRMEDLLAKWWWRYNEVESHASIADGICYINDHVKEIIFVHRPYLAPYLQCNAIKFVFL